MKQFGIGQLHGVKPAGFDCADKRDVFKRRRPRLGGSDISYQLPVDGAEPGPLDHHYFITGRQRQRLDQLSR